MTPMIWMILMIILLVIEFIRIEFIGACGAMGALCGLIANLCGLNVVLQIVIAIGVTLLLLVTVRPVAMKAINRMKRESDIQNLVGADAIVICAIDNSQGVGVVEINGRQWSARSHRPNAVIREGEVVKVVAMNKNTAIVDDRKRNRDTGFL